MNSVEFNTSNHSDQPIQTPTQEGGVKGAFALWKAKDSELPKPSRIVRRVKPIEKKTYKNEESLLLEPISSFPIDEIVEIAGYALVIDEVLDDMGQRDSAYLHPYTRERLKEEDLNKILNHPKAIAKVKKMEKRKKRLPPGISEKTLLQLFDLATTLARYGLDLEEKEIGDKGFSEHDEAENLMEFETYYKALAPVERTALDMCKVGFFNFGEMYDDLLKGSVCRREIAKDLWKLLAKIGPHLLPEEVVRAAKRYDDAFLHDYIPQ